MLAKLPFLKRFGAKLVCEFLPAAAVSLIGAALLNHYGRAPAPPPTVVADPASAEMLKMAREEHARIVVLMEKREEALDAADRLKAAEQAAGVAAQKAKAAQAKAAALAATAEISARKMAAKQPAPRPEPVALVGPPLALSPPVAPPNVKVASVSPRGSDNLIVTKWRETTAAVERIPSWLRTTVERAADGIASISLPKLPPVRLL